MDIVFSGPFRTGSFIWLQHPETWTLTVIAKTTFRLQPGELSIAEEQDALCTDDVYWNDDRTKSLYAPTDIVPFKPRADVLLVGSAFAPRKEPVRSLIARLIVGEMDKSIEVLGERTLMRDGQIREGFPFAKMPIRYERAAGGPGTTNPVGMRSDLLSNNQPQIQLPNLQPPFMTLEEIEADPLLPIGFGPIAPTWPERRTMLGAHGSLFPSSDWMDKPIPPDISMEFFNSAPFDQQPDVLHERERIVLENLHAEYPVLTTSLPGIKPRAMLERPDGSTELIPMIADTLWIDTDRGVCTLTWRGQSELRQRSEPGRIVISQAKIPNPSASYIEPSAGSVRGGQIAVPASPEAPKETALAGTGPADTQDPFSPLAPQDVPNSNRAPLAPQPRASSFANTDTPPPTLSRAAISHERSTLPVSGFRRPEGPSTLNNSAALSPSGNPSGNARSAPSPSAAPAESFTAPIQAGTAASASQRRPSTPFFAAVDAAPISSPGRTVPPPSQGRGSSPFFPAIETPNPTAPRTAERSPNEALPDESRAHGPATAVNRVPAFLKAPAKPISPTKLIWFDPALASRLRAQRGLHSNGDPNSDRLLVSDALQRGEAARPDELPQIVQDASLSDQGFEPPLSLIEGTLEFSFDEVAQLKASISVLLPLAQDDEELKEVLNAATHLITASLTPHLGIVAAEHIGRVKEALSRSSRMLPSDYLESHVQRMLLEQRAYKRKTLFGKTWIRAELQSATTAIPVYIPDPLSSELPMYRRLNVRMLGEVDLREDEYELSPCLIRLCAIGRTVSH